MTSQFLIVAARLALKTCGFLVIAGALASPAMTQTYIYGQAGLQTGKTPSGVSIADFNGDGRPDVAVANQGDNTVSVFLTKSRGTGGGRGTDGTFPTNAPTNLSILYQGTDRGRPLSNIRLVFLYRRRLAGDFHRLIPNKTRYLSFDPNCIAYCLDNIIGSC